MPERNDPCPCGSGRKYKKCHLQGEEAARRPASAAAEHQLDEELAGKILKFAERNLGLSLQDIIDTWLGSGTELQIAVPCLAYMYEHEGKTLVERFVEANGYSLRTEERSWLEDQQRAWLSVWSCIEVQPPMISLTDLLTGERREVHEVMGSKVLRPGMRILARVVDHGGKSLLCGMYPAPLMPSDAERVVQCARKKQRLPRKTPIDRVRSFEVATMLLDLWAVVLDELRNAPPPTLQNSDGDPLVLIDEHYEIERGRDEILKRLRGLELEETKEGVFRMLRVEKGGEEVTIVAFIDVEAERMKISTNSIRRADRAKKITEGTLASCIRWRGRKIVDPSSEKARSDFREAPTKAIPPEEIAERAAVARKFKEKHYAQWLDSPIPALGEMTPREAVRTRAGKQRVRLLLEGITVHETNRPAAERFDPSPLYQALRLRKPR